MFFHSGSKKCVSVWKCVVKRSCLVWDCWKNKKYWEPAASQPIACLLLSHGYWAKPKKSKSFQFHINLWSSHVVSHPSSEDKQEQNWLFSCRSVFWVLTSTKPVWTLCGLAKQSESYTFDLLCVSVSLTQQLTEWVSSRGVIFAAVQLSV